MEPQPKPEASTNQPTPDQPPQGQIDFDGLIKKLIASCPPDQKQEFSGCLQAAQQIKANLGKMDEVLAQIKGPQDVPEVVAEKTKKLINIVVAHGAKKFMPSTYLAAQVIALQGLRLVQAQMNIQITKPMIAETFRLLIKKLNDMFGITPQVLQQVAAQKKSAPGATPQQGVTSQQAGGQP